MCSFDQDVLCVVSYPVGTDNKAAAERWLSCLESLGLRVVLPRDAAGAQQDSSSTGLRDHAPEADARMQDRWGHHAVTGLFAFAIGDSCCKQSYACMCACMTGWCKTSCYCAAAVASACGVLSPGQSPALQPRSTMQCMYALPLIACTISQQQHHQPPNTC